MNSPFARIRAAAEEVSDRVSESSTKIVSIVDKSIMALVAVGVVAAIALVMAVSALVRRG